MVVFTVTGYEKQPCLHKPDWNTEIDIPRDIHNRIARNRDQFYVQTEITGMPREMYYCYWLWYFTHADE